MGLNPPEMSDVSQIDLGSACPPKSRMSFHDFHATRTINMAKGLPRLLAGQHEINHQTKSSHAF